LAAGLDQDKEEEAVCVILLIGLGSIVDQVQIF